MTTLTLPRTAPHATTTRYRVLIGAVLIQLILGTVYGYSIFWLPLSQEIFAPVVTFEQAEQMSLVAAAEATVVATDAEAQQLLTEQRNLLKYAFSICILSFAVVMVVAGRVQDVKGPRFTATIGAVLMGTGFLLAGLMGSPVVFYLCHAAVTGIVALLGLMLFHALFGRLDREQYPILRDAPLAIVAAVVVAGVVLGNQYVGQLGQLDKLLMIWGTVGFLAGAGIGFAYVCPIAALIKWFPGHKGLVAGIAVAGFGFGAYLFKGETFGAMGYIDRHDITQFFLVHGLVCLVGIAIGAMMLRNPPEIAAAITTGGAATDRHEQSWQDTLRRPAFYVLWLMFFSGAVAGLMVIGIVKGFAGQQLVDAASAGGALGAEQHAELIARGAAAVGYLAIFNAIGRIAWGMVSDRIGRTAAFAAMFLFQAATMLLLTAAHTEPSIAVAASIVGFNFGGNFALFPSATADLFGTRNLGVNYGWVFTSYGIAGVVGIAAGNASIEQTGSYFVAFSFAAVLCLISAGLAVGMHIHARRPSVAPT